MIEDLLNSIANRELDSVYKCLEIAVDLDVCGTKGMSPLSEAVEREDIRIVELLVARGANTNFLYNDNCTALHLAIDISIDATIQAGGRPGDEPVGIIKALLHGGANIDAMDSDGKTPYDLASSYGSKKIIRFLERYRKDN